MEQMKSSNFARYINLPNRIFIVHIECLSLTALKLIILITNFQDYVQNAVQEFILSSIGCFIVILSLAHFLMVLSANYAHIRGHDKFTELQDLHDLTSETLTLHDRGGIQDGTYPWQNK